ncbi:MAG: tRNA lysidine(34) synthetase TilS [Sphaerochaeta sp.]
MPTTDAIVPKTIERFLTSYAIDADSRIAVAFSGGSDSLALLIALKELISNDRISVFYVNHHLRGKQELTQELKLCHANCNALGLPLTILDLGEGSVKSQARATGMGTEASARNLRYQALIAACKDHCCNYLATAHNADDQLETVLMRLFQASSVSSLKGIEAFSTLAEEVVLIRPLLALPHRVLREYVSHRGFSWAEDSTNDEDAYLRNKIRHTIKPTILTVFPKAYESITTMSERFSDAAVILQRLEDEYLAQISMHSGHVSFSLTWYQATERELRERLLYRMYATVCDEDVRRPRRAMIERMYGRLESSSPQSHWYLEAGNSSMTLSDGLVVWTRIKTVPHFVVPLQEPCKEQCIALPGSTIFTIQPIDADADHLRLRLDAQCLRDAVIRSAEQGDCIELEAGTVSLAKLLSSYHIPKSRHHEVPILCDRTGVVAVFARMYGGRDRLARRFKTPLARRLTNIYSSNKRNNDSEIEKR